MIPASTFDRALPFLNGAPGLTNGVGALKHQLGLTPRHGFDRGTGFVSIPGIADRCWRSSFLVDGAYVAKGKPRFVPKTRAEASACNTKEIASLASFFMVPSMGLTPARAAAAIPELTSVVEFLSTLEPPRFPGPIDRTLAATGRSVYANACAQCHGHYDNNLDRPKLELFPNWAGDVGTDRTRVDAFTSSLEAAARATLHGQTYIDVKTTGVTVAPLLPGLWASAPYFVNGSVPTIRHVLEPATRPVRFRVGGHDLDFQRLGIAGTSDARGDWQPLPGHQAFAGSVVIDTSSPGFSNRGHEREVNGLSAADRDALIEYLKLL